MKTLRSLSSLFVLSGMALLLSSAVVARSAAPRLAQQPAPSAPDPGAALVAKMCNECHDSTRILALRRTMSDWESVLHKMIEEGAVGTEKDFETVFEYLLARHGKVFVNNATAREFSKVLGFSTELAEAVVKYRMANGPFADIDALLKVPGIDPKALEARKDALSF